MKEFIYRKLIKYFVLISPIIDIMTSYMYYHNFSITIGLIIKALIMLLAIFYLIILDKEKRVRNFFFLFVIAICCFVNIYNSMDVIKIVKLTYFTYLFKYVYYLVMLLFFLRWFREYNIKLSELRIPICIIALATILAVITNTSYISYQNNPYKEGFSLWYSSANELGNMLCLLFPVAIYNAFHNKDGIKLDLYLIPILGATLLILGTKVGLLGYFLIILTYLILRIILCRLEKLDMRFMIMLTLFVAPLMFFKYLPGVFNIYVSVNHDSSTALLSGRDDALGRIYKERENENTLVKIFGKSYYGELKEINQIMLVEQDFIDVFFMYGYVGIILVFCPLIYLYYKGFITFFKLCKKDKKISKKYLAVAFSITLCLMVSFISGHAILSPSVSLYLVLLIAILLNLDFNLYKDKNVLVLKSENSAIKIDKKYNVEIVENEKIFRNKLLAYLTVKNKKYDYIIMNENDTDYMKTYLKYSNGKHISDKEFR